MYKDASTYHDKMIRITAPDPAFDRSNNRQALTQSALVIC